MKVRKVPVLICCLLLIPLLPLSAGADMGPKPSVSVTVEGLSSGTLYYATLLSSQTSNGPLSVYEEGEPTEYGQDPGALKILKKFAAYPDRDGYHFLPYFQECRGNDTFSWTYYPPDPFKILLYFPKEELFLVSESYASYAFDSYYTVRLSENSLTENAARPLIVEKSYDHSGEAAGLAARIVMTAALELVLALAFGFREKKQLLFLASVNVLTQVLLNVSLNVSAYFQGSGAAIHLYILLELLVCIGEAVLYVLLLPNFSKKYFSAGRAVGYAAAANVLSFAAGFGLAGLLPGIF